MTESDHHKLWTTVACGCAKSVVQERRLADDRRLDCTDEQSRVCAEIQLTKSRISYDLEKLLNAKSSGICDSPKLIVRERDYEYARRLPNSGAIEILPDTPDNLSKAIASCVFGSLERKIR